MESIRFGQSKAAKSKSYCLLSNMHANWLRNMFEHVGSCHMVQCYVCMSLISTVRYQHPAAFKKLSYGLDAGSLNEGGG